MIWKIEIEFYILNLICKIEIEKWKGKLKLKNKILIIVLSTLIVFIVLFFYYFSLFNYYLNFKNQNQNCPNEITLEINEVQNLNSESNQINSNENELIETSESNETQNSNSESASENQNQEIYLGEYRITAYCPCEICCGKWALNRPVDEYGNQIVNGASGNRLTSKVSVAANLPFGTKLKIEGLNGEFIVEDRTSEWVQEKYNGKVIDIYVADHDECYEFLSNIESYTNVYIIK